MSYCSRLLPPTRAEDALQQTFLQAYVAMIGCDSHLDLRPWLYRIAHNCAITALRQSGWNHEQLDERIDGVERPPEALERAEQLRSVVDGVPELPKRQREALVARELEGRTYQEIAIGGSRVRR